MKRLSVCAALTGCLCLGAMAEEVWPIDICCADRHGSPARVVGVRFPIPYGENEWVTGLDVGYKGESAGFWGFQFNLAHSIVSDQMGGLQLGFHNEANHLLGVSVGGWNSAPRAEGGQVGLYNRSEKILGFQAGVVNSVDEAQGIQIGIWNDSPAFSGLQFGIVNLAYQVECGQIGLINTTEQMHGFQLGLINVIHGSSVPFLPILNFKY